MPEAKRLYQQVLEVEPRHATALAFLGMVYHMSDELDQAILTYHEVRAVSPSLPFPSVRFLPTYIPPYLSYADAHLQALSIEPTNQHVLDLLNVALESNLDTPPFARAVGAEMWNAIVRERKDARGRVIGVLPAEAALLQAEMSVAASSQAGDDSAMDLSVDSAR